MSFPTSLAFIAGVLSFTPKYRREKSEAKAKAKAEAEAQVRKDAIWCEKYLGRPVDPNPDTIDREIATAYIFFNARANIDSLSRFDKAAALAKMTYVEQLLTYYVIDVYLTLFGKPINYCTVTAQEIYDLLHKKHPETFVQETQLMKFFELIRENPAFQREIEAYVSAKSLYLRYT